jgi:hypothetical protein
MSNDAQEAADQHGMLLLQLTIHGLFALVGIALLIAAAVIGQKAYSLVYESRTATGVISGTAQVRTVQGKSTSTGSQLVPVVSFEDSHGNLISFRAGINTFISSYQLGERVEVIYSSSTPVKAAINTFWSIWGSCTALAALGVIFSSTGLYASLRTHSWQAFRHNRQ